MQSEESDTFISRFYLGQQINAVLDGDLRRPPPNFKFQSCHKRRTSFSKLAQAKRQRLNSREEVRARSHVGSSESRSIPISAEEMNTPMFCALHEHKGQNKSAYLKSISNQSGIMFWLGYLYKKISQNNCEQKVRTINEKGYKEYLKEQKTLSA